VVLGSRGSRIRCLVVWSAASSGLAGVTHKLRAPIGELRHSSAGLSRTPLDVVLSEVAALALLVCATWLWAVTTAVVVQALRGRVGRITGVPAGVRRAVLAACGVALASGVVAPTQATAPDPRPAVAQHLDRSVLDGLPLPDRTVSGRPPGPPAPADPGRTVVVRSGDTLWSIATRDLAPDSPDSRVAAHWRAIYAANRHRIGPDPDVIVPGTRLTLPGKDLP
jgi:hypothetical protein